MARVSESLIFKSGHLFKLGDGPINFNWNPRYITIEFNTLYYYSESSDRNPRGILALTGCTVTELYMLKDHPWSFTIQLSSGKKIHFSHLEKDEAEKWRLAILAAAKTKLESAAEKAEEVVPEPQLPERRGSIGELPSDLESFYSRLEAESTSQSFQLVAIKQGLRIEALQLEPAALNSSAVWRVVTAWLCILLCDYYFVSMPFYLEIALFVLTLLLLRSAFAPGSVDCFRAFTVVDASSKDIFNVLMDLSQRSRWDYMVPHTSAIETISSHVDLYSVALGLGRLAVLRYGLLERFAVMKRYWERSETDVYTIVQRSIYHKQEEKGKVRAEYQEGVIIQPIEPGRCKVTFLVRFTGHYPALLHLYIAKQRVASLSGLREFILQQICEKQAEEEEQITDMQEENRELAPEESGSERNCELILYGGEANVSLEARLPGYTRHKSGGIRCVNQQELDSQKGIVLELIAKAGKQLMKGENIVGISLPVRIFEPRSTLERMVDWWCTAPIYLMNASLAVSSM
jgi:hypothetical protein